MRDDQRRDDKLTATASAPAAMGDAARETAQQSDFAPTGGRRAVGVYERPAQRARLSLPLLVILILAALVSVVATARFLF
ncbi:MAG TPA: hypothetical protein VEZ40_03950 [Pyrinomonadaceae bacterium]|nr:hypothetical protein [Pyrinomonadaceae bacterium]